MYYWLNYNIHVYREQYSCTAKFKERTKGVANLSPWQKVGSGKGQGPAQLHSQAPWERGTRLGPTAKVTDLAWDKLTSIIWCRKLFWFITQFVA